MIEFTDLNWWAILVATLASFAVGWLWYGPLFGKAWVAALGKTEDEIQPTPTPFIIGFVTALVTCIAMAALIQALGIDTWLGGICIGLVAGIGFITMAMVSDGAFCGWSWTLVAIQAGYRTLYCVIMGLILAVW